MLAAMFSGRHTVYKDPEKGHVFVDRDGMHFRHILNWLRDGVAPNLSESEYSELLREAEFYQLLGLVDKINEVLTKKKEDEQVDSEFTRGDIIRCVQSSCRKFRGVNLSGLDLSKLDLSNMDFIYARLKNVNFSLAYIYQALFQHADAEKAIFDNTSLNRCNFTGANLRGSRMTGAILQLAKLQGKYIVSFNLLSSLFISPQNLVYICIFFMKVMANLY
ncbi:FH protein interacting protein FIP2-like isoform X2 [Bidens hawaiensis]